MSEQTILADAILALDEADTAFAVLAICDLSPQAKSQLKTAWRKVQDVLSKVKGPNSIYTQAVNLSRAHE